MKKVFLAALIGSMLASLTACLPSTNTPTVVKAPGQSAAATAQN